jgi:hypothetical protein
LHLGQYGCQFFVAAGGRAPIDVDGGRALGGQAVVKRLEADINGRERFR